LGGRPSPRPPLLSTSPPPPPAPPPRDCCHQSEPGCAVRAAVEAETLDAERVESFHKLEREEQFLEAKQDAALRARRNKELRQLMKSVNRFYRERGR